jgi:hypothetical protein
MSVAAAGMWECKTWHHPPLLVRRPINPLVREVREGFRFGVGFIYGSLLFLLIGGALVFLYILVVALTTKSLSFD